MPPGLLRRMHRMLERVIGADQSVGVSPEVFLNTFLSLLQQSIDTGEAATADLGPGVFVLVIAPANAKNQSECQNAAIDMALSRLDQRSDVASLTWSALRKARPNFEPSYTSWSGDKKALLESDIGIVFFVDPTIFAKEMIRFAELHGYYGLYDNEASQVRISDGSYRVDIALDALMVEALWTMRGTTTVTHERAGILPLEFDSYANMASALRQRFPDLDLEAKGGHWLAEYRGNQGEILCRRLVLQCRASGLDESAFLARACFEDLIEDGSYIHRKIKAPGFLAAYPDTIYVHKGPFVEVMARDSENNTRYIMKAENTPSTRHEHLALLAKMSLNYHQFSGHVFRAEIGPSHAVCLAGFQAVSLAAEPSLVAGLLDKLSWLPDRVRLMAQYENGLVICDIDVVEEATEVLLLSLNTLCRHLFDDMGDPLGLDFSMLLNQSARGKVDVQEVPGTYFDLCERAALTAENGPPGKAHYYQGLCYEILGLSEKASDCFARALRYDRDDGELNLLLGRTLNDLGNFDHAAGFLEKAVNALPEDADANNSLGVAYQCAGSSHDAVRAFERAATLSPEDPTILVNLGRAYFDTNRLESAREILTLALERAPELFEAHASLAMLHFRTGESANALIHANKALAERPEDEAMRELVALLVEEEGESAS